MTLPAITTAEIARIPSEGIADGDYRRTRAYHLAAQAVTCPKCRARFGFECKSTGGGNFAVVATHKARTARIAGWTDEQRHQYGEMVRRLRPRSSVSVAPHAPAEEIDRVAAEAEAAAAPIPVEPTKRPSPKGVRLSENQAEEIERTVANGGVTSASTAHFHGDHQHRQTINALRDKGILAEGDLSTDGYDREYTLTEFGWQVYRQHRLIIRRFSDEQINALMGQRSTAAVTS